MASGRDGSSDRRQALLALASGRRRRRGSRSAGATATRQDCGDVWLSKVDLRLQCGMPCSKLEASTVQHGTLSGAGYLHQSPGDYRDTCTVRRVAPVLRRAGGSGGLGEANIVLAHQPGDRADRSRSYLSVVDPYDRNQEVRCAGKERLFRTISFFERY
jgi:hypothetical protein